MNGMSMPARAAKAQPSPKQGHTTGKAIRIDSAAATVRIAHHKVEAHRSPATTMTFGTRRPELQWIRVGERVEFTFEIQNGSALITQIRKIR
jgi:Cu/Ag efflux protein CusF